MRIPTEHALRAGSGEGEAVSPQPAGIAVGPGEDLWFTDDGTNVKGHNLVGRMTPDGEVQEFPIPSVNAEPAAIVMGADGAMWFTEPERTRWAASTASAASPSSRFRM